MPKTRPFSASSDAYARFEARHGAKEEALRAYAAFQDVLPHHPLIEAGIADVEAGKPIQPLVKTAQDGAAEVLYGLGAAGGRQGDELAAMIYLRLSLYLEPQNSLAPRDAGRHLRPAQAERGCHRGLWPSTGHEPVAGQCRYPDRV